MQMEWFENVFGCVEDLKRMSLRGDDIIIRRKKYPYGKFRVSDLSEFEEPLPTMTPHMPRSLHKVCADVMDLQNDPENNGSTFQIASNMNCLEFRKPLQTKSEGITGYVLDPTQGPHAVICTPVATLYRNYFLSDVNLLSQFPSIVVTGGYPNISSVPDGYDDYMKYQVGVHERCQVLMGSKLVRNNRDDQFVNHVLCSALPFGYTVIKDERTIEMNKYLLRSQYRLTLLNAIKMCSKKCFLTRLGTGSFGGEKKWCDDAIAWNCDLIDSGKIEVWIVEK